MDDTTPNDDWPGCGSCQILAYGEREALTRCADLAAERDSYRRVAQAALAEAHRLTEQLTRINGRYTQLLEQFREARAEIRSYRQQRAA
jgi:hypothetical protein